jgi:hypothetical protein
MTIDKQVQARTLTPPLGAAFILSFRFRPFARSTEVAPEREGPIKIAISPSRGPFLCRYNQSTRSFRKPSYD